MNIEKLTIEPEQMRKLLHLANSDAALLYLYLQSGNAAADAPKALSMGEDQCGCALALLRQMGLWTEERKASFVPGERPAYTENDVIRTMDTDGDFRSLYGEVQRLLGKTLNTEELKLLLGFHRYLGLPGEVISLLVCYCKERSRQKGSLRNPSLRTIEKEAYFWAEQGIDTFEEAAAYIRTQNLRNTQLEQLKKLLQIRGRNLTPGENRYVESWLEMGFEKEVIAMAYERTCLNTGGLSWAYMNKILTRWHEAGLHTVQAIQQGDKKPPMGATGALGQAELEAIRQVMQEG